MDIVRIAAGMNEAPRPEEIGAKAANLARVAMLGLAVPPAFVLPVQLHNDFMQHNRRAQAELTDALAKGIEWLESLTGKRFGNRRQPLLVSVRSGAAQSMPGMLDTVLNVGCTLAATNGLIRVSGNPQFAWDCRRRFLEGYIETVLGLDAAPCTAQLDMLVSAERVNSDRDLDGEALERLAGDYESIIADANAAVPDDAMEQLVASAHAVYRSWDSDRARTYRRLEKLDHLAGTAVLVQAMVFGNRGLMSGTGVAFSRNPSTGAAQPVIDMLFDAQGEDVVSGRRTPETEASIVRLLPAVAEELNQALKQLEREFADVQDIEFTIEEGRLWVLQTRSAKRTPRAALRFAVDLVREGMISREEGVARVSAVDLGKVAVARFTDGGEPVARGIGAAAGVAVGRAVFDSAAAQRWTAGGDRVILVRPDMSTTDIAGLAVSAGIMTASGGRTAHAVLVGRQMGKACVVGCDGLAVDPHARCAQLAGATIQEGDWLSIDGDTGDVFLGQRKIVTDQPEAELAQVAHWRMGDPAVAATH
ncbi:MAG TPA: PEP/pyruvate-binding domain-containing protein [Burkholderiales bacterium]|nr:PEP/pyruvate-binding domain-containing protein [Burkholderiales bacterium]